MVGHPGTDLQLVGLAHMYIYIYIHHIIFVLFYGVLFYYTLL